MSLTVTNLRDHALLGLTQSLCPECLALVPAKIIVKTNGRVYFRKRCPTHGVREDFVCSDAKHYDQLEFSVPGRIPPQFGVEPDRGCPFDCGLCTEHEQHTCVGLVEITSSCNLTCPLCYSSSVPRGRHLSLAECRAAIDRLVAVEGRPEVLQLSGGEPTLHPDFAEILDYAIAQPIDIVMVNTNGIRLAHDARLVERLAACRQRLEVYFQFDGFRDDIYEALRGEPLMDIKLRALENLGRHGIRTILVTTLQGGVNVDQVGPIVEFGLARPWITGISFQPATYSGRYVLPETLEQRITFPDVIRAVAEQTGQSVPGGVGREPVFRENDFMPLPCAHPNCHSLTYAYRHEGRAIPLTRFIQAREHLDLLANGITFNRVSARRLIENYLGSAGCCSSGNCGGGNGHFTDVGLSVAELDPIERVAIEFFRRALGEDLSPADVFRITITSFLDAYNFDVRRVMKCCIHHVLPSGHVIPFCAYNVLYRDGHVPLPEIRQVVESLTRTGAPASAEHLPLAKIE